MSAKALATVLAAAVGLYSIVLGIYTSNWAIENLEKTFYYFTFTFNDLKQVCRFSVVPFLLFALGISLLIHTPKRLLRIAEERQGPPASEWSQAIVILTVGMTVIGVFLLSTAGVRVVEHVARDAAGNLVFGTARDWIEVAGDVSQLLIGVYLFFGAGPICRWQIKRIQRCMYQSPSEHSYESEAQDHTAGGAPEDRGPVGSDK